MKNLNALQNRSLIPSLISMALTFSAATARAEKPELKLHLHRFEAGMGSTENGFGLQAGLRFEEGQGHISTVNSNGRNYRAGEEKRGDDKGWATLTLHQGLPALRIAGQAELIPVKLLNQKLHIDGHHSSAELVIIPLAGRLQLDAFADGNRGRGQIVIEPTVAAQFKIATRQTNGYRGKARLLLGPVAGVTSDIDGSAGILGIRTGADVEFEVDLSPKDRLQVAMGGAVINATSDAMDPRAWESHFKMGYERDLGDASTIGAELVYEGTKFDPIGDENRNAGPSSFGGLKVTYVPAL